MIKTLIVDDSAIVRSMLSKVMKNDIRFELAGMADNGQNAVKMNDEFHPDLIVMDVNMPIMNGIEATRKILNHSSPAIVAFTTEDSAEIAFQSLSAGVLEVVNKPDFVTMTRQTMEEFCNKLYYIAMQHKITGKATDAKTELTAVYANTTESELKKNGCSFSNISVLLIGASTGGPVAVQKVLNGLKKDFPLPVLLTQHIDSNFDFQLAKWLSETTDFDVHLAMEGELLKKGNVYMAPAGKHLALEKGRDSKLRIRLDDSEPLNFLKPSVDRMFINCSELLKSQVLSVLLTGMGKDGAAGCQKILHNGGYTIVEDESTCVIFGMPKAAIDLKAAKEIIPLHEISNRINKMIPDYSGQ